MPISAQVFSAVVETGFVESSVKVHVQGDNGPLCQFGHFSPQVGECNDSEVRAGWLLFSSHLFDPKVTEVVQPLDDRRVPYQQFRRVGHQIGQFVDFVSHVAHYRFQFGDSRESPRNQFRLRPKPLRADRAETVTGSDGDRVELVNVICLKHHAVVRLLPQCCQRGICVVREILRFQLLPNSVFRCTLDTHLLNPHEARIVLRSQDAVGETFSHDHVEREAKSPRVVGRTLVESKDLLRDVAKQVVGSNGDVSAVQPAFQQRPEILHAVGVDVFHDVGDGVVNRLVQVGKAQFRVRA